jgi:hypothetical protein
VDACAAGVDGWVDGSTETVAAVEGISAVTDTDGTLTVGGPDFGTVTVARVDKTLNVSDSPEPCWFCPDASWFWFCPEPLWRRLIA